PSTSTCPCGRLRWRCSIPALTDRRSRSALERVFPGNSDLAARMRALDWSQTPLGAAEAWPLSLRSHVATLLELPSPAIIFWGPDQTQLYNDGYAVIMGPRHPRYL